MKEELSKRTKIFQDQEHTTSKIKNRQEDGAWVTSLDYQKIEQPAT